MHGKLKFGKRVKLVGSKSAGFSGALATAEAAAQGQSRFVVTKFGQQPLDFGGELAGLADAFERGVGGDFTGLNPEELAALELAAADGAFGVDGAGASAVIEGWAGLVDP